MTNTARHPLRRAHHAAAMHAWCYVLGVYRCGVDFRLYPHQRLAALRAQAVDDHDGPRGRWLYREAFERGGALLLQTLCVSDPALQALAWELLGPDWGSKQASELQTALARAGAIAGSTFSGRPPPTSPPPHPSPPLHPSRPADSLLPRAPRATGDTPSPCLPAAPSLTPLTTVVANDDLAAALNEVLARAGYVQRVTGHDIFASPVTTEEIRAAVSFTYASAYSDAGVHVTAAAAAYAVLLRIAPSTPGPGLVFSYLPHSAYYAEGSTPMSTLGSSLQLSKCTPKVPIQVGTDRKLISVGKHLCDCRVVRLPQAEPVAGDGDNTWPVSEEAYHGQLDRLFDTLEEMGKACEAALCAFAGVW